MIVQDLVNSALEMTGRLTAAGRGGSASELARGLTTFNRMVDSSGTSKANIFTEQIQQFPTVASQQKYTWGTGGNWNATRPQRITQANLLLPTSPTVRRNLQLWDRKAWASFALQQIYTYPEGLYCDYANPLANVYFRPIPDAVYQIETYSWLLNAPAATLTTALSYPAGYEEFWLYNLAERLAMARGIAVPPDVREMARKSRVAVARMNLKSPHIPSADFGAGSGLGSRKGDFNYYSGEPA